MILSFVKDDTGLYTNEIDTLAFSNVKICLLNFNYSSFGKVLSREPSMRFWVSPPALH